jgi:hypothetical protein
MTTSWQRKKTIDRAEASLLARREVERNDLPWTEPIGVHFGFWNYHVWTMADSRGGNIIIKVNRRSGEATIVGLIPK